MRYPGAVAAERFIIVDGSNYVFRAFFALQQGRGGGRNIVLQDLCANDFADHLALAFDHVALREVLNALDPLNTPG